MQTNGVGRPDEGDGSDYNRIGVLRFTEACARSGAQGERQMVRFVNKANVTRAGEVERGDTIDAPAEVSPIRDDGSSQSRDLANAELSRLRERGASRHWVDQRCSEAPRL